MESSNHPTKKRSLADIDWKCAAPALIVVALLAIPAILFEEQTSQAVNGFFNTFVEKTSAFYVVIPVVLVGIGLWMAFSKYGKIVLGDPKERPAISNFTYIATLMAMCYGATIMRTGTIQWANIAAEPPFGIEPYTNEAIIVGSAYSIFLWGLQLAAIYVITAPAVAYFVHVRGQNNVKISQLCRSLLGDKFADGLLGKLVDIIFVIALVLGAATTIGLASPVLSAVFGKLFHLEPSFGLDFVMTVAMIVIFTTSAFLGIEKGIERLSDLNVYSVQKEKVHEHPQTRRLQPPIFQTGQAHGGAAPANGAVLRDRSAGQRQSGERRGCCCLRISASNPSCGRGLFSPQSAPYADVFRDL